MVPLSRPMSGCGGGMPMKRTRRVLVAVVATVGVLAGFAAPSAGAVERQPSPMVAPKDQAAYVAKAVAFGVPKQLAEDALHNQELFLGLPVEVVEESGPVVYPASTGSATADA